MNKKIKLVEERILANKENQMVTLHFFTSDALQAVINLLATEDAQSKNHANGRWYNSRSGRFGIVISLADVKPSFDKDNNVDGVFVYPYVMQSYYDSSINKLVRTSIGHELDPVFEMAINEFNDKNKTEKRIIAKVGLSSKQADKDGKLYEGKRLYMVVHFDTKKMLNDLSELNVDFDKDYTPEEAANALKPVFATFFVNEVTPRIKEFLADLDKAVVKASAQSRSDSVIPEEQGNER